MKSYKSGWLWDPVVAAGQDQCHGRLQADLVTHRHVDRVAGRVRAAQRLSEGAAAVRRQRKRVTTQLQGLFLKTKYPVTETPRSQPNGGG